MVRSGTRSVQRRSDASGYKSRAWGWGLHSSGVGGTGGGLEEGGSRQWAGLPAPRGWGSVGAGSLDMVSRAVA